jgi:hypothetical protein
LGVTGAVEFTALVRLLGVLAKLNIASERPERHNRSPKMLRLLMNADLEGECFFIRIFPGGLIARTQARGAARLRRLSQNIVVCSASTFIR